MSENLTKAQDVFLGRINHICGKFGLNNIMAQLYAVLYLKSRPMSLNEMVERLKISKGSVSVNIRALERYGAVRRVWVKGSRKDYYEAEENISKVIMDRVKSMIQGRLAEVDSMLRSSLAALNSVNSSDKEEKETIKVFKQKLNELGKLENKARRLFNLFNSGLLNNILNINTKKKNTNIKKEFLHT